MSESKKGNERSKMKILGIAFTVVAVAGLFLVTMAPFGHAEYSFGEDPVYDYDAWLYFNERLKLSVTVDGETESLTLGDAIWLEIGAYPFENTIFMGMGIGFALLGGLYKIFVPNREDKRVFTFTVLLGGAFGLTGTLLFIKFNNNSIYPVPVLDWGFYTSIVIFSLFILIGLVTMYDSLKNPYAVEPEFHELF